MQRDLSPVRPSLIASVLGFVIGVYRVGQARRTQSPQNAQAGVGEAVEDFLVRASRRAGCRLRTGRSVLLLLAQTDVMQIDAVLVGRLQDGLAGKFGVVVNDNPDLFQ